MRKIIQLLLCAGLIWACEKDPVKLYMNSIASDVYYTDEILPESLYGKWRLARISGGFGGDGYEPDFDYLEIKKIGIYGLIRNDSVFEYGRIELDTFDLQSPEKIQIRLVAATEGDQAMYPQEKYVEICDESMNLISPCCDLYNHHFKRSR